MEPNDIVGNKFGKLRVKKYLKREDTHRKNNRYLYFYVCQCECGKSVEAERKNLMAGHIQSCGCLRRKLDGDGAEDILGRRFGKLTVLKCSRTRLSEKKWNRPYYLCECDCGTKVEVQRNNLIHGHTRSCGCLKNMSGEQNKGWKGYGDISGSYWAHIRHGAKSGHLPFKITIQQAWKLFKLQRGICALTGMSLAFEPSGSKNRLTKAHTASLDRIDSSLGYVLGNVQWVHKDVNRMKLNMANKKFLEMCKLVAKHQESILA